MSVCVCILPASLGVYIDCQLEWPLLSTVIVGLSGDCFCVWACQRAFNLAVSVTADSSAPGNLFFVNKWVRAVVASHVFVYLLVHPNSEGCVMLPVEVEMLWKGRLSISSPSPHPPSWGSWLAAGPVFASLEVSDLHVTHPPRGGGLSPG